MKTILYKRTRLGKIQQWKIWVEEKGESGHPEVCIEFGQTDGKKQTTSDIIKEGVNVGKSNETTPLEQANLTAERKITKQREEGYFDTVEEAQVEKSISWTERFSKEMCFYKPKNTITEKKLQKLERDGKAIYTQKEDGQMYIIRKTKAFGVEIYSRRMELETDKFPHLAESFKILPNGTVLLGEMTVTKFKNHMKAYKEASRICRSDTEKSLKRQAEIEKTTYVIFDVAFENRTCLLTSETYKNRYKRIKALSDLAKSKFIRPAKIINKSHKEALDWAKEEKIEGFVVWDADGIMEDGGAYTWNGKAYRPNVLWKVKPKYEDDFIVRFDPANGIGEYGKGKNNGKVGSVFTYQLEDGVETFLGKCGGGLSDKQRDFYTIASYPRVWEIQYDALQPKTGALRYPVFYEDRTLVGDKILEECIMSEDIKLAREDES